MGFLGDTFAVCVAVVLITAGFWHGKRHQSLVQAIADHAVIPERLSATVAWLVSITEVLVAAGLLVAPYTALVADDRFWRIGAALLLSSFAAYLWLVWSQSGRVECGCLLKGDVVSPNSIGRSLVLAFFALLSSFSPSVSPEQQIFVLVVGLTLAVGLVSSFSAWNEAGSLWQKRLEEHAIIQGKVTTRMG